MTQGEAQPPPRAIIVTPVHVVAVDLRDGLPQQVEVVRPAADEVAEGPDALHLG